MSMNTPYGSIISTKNLKEFQELDELGSEQYMVAIADDTTGSGGKIKATRLSSSMISSDADNQLIIGSDNKLYAKMSSITDVIDAQNMYETGSVLTDERGLNQLNKMKRSTFDRSKFTVVGTPTITDDGIASGFSGSSYLRTPTIDFTKPWKIASRFKVSDTSSSKMLWAIAGGGWFDYIYIYDQVLFTFKTSDNVERNLKTKSLQPNVYYITVQGWTGEIYYSELYDDNGNLLDRKTLNSNLTLNITSNYLTLGFGSSGRYLTKGSIDLPRFSITVDGVEVFNGNKTGIDQIKKDNYEVVGSPTISDDGIVSGFSGNNYLNVNDITFGSNFCIYCDFILKNIQPNQENFFWKTTWNFVLLLSPDNTNFRFRLPKNSDGSEVISSSISLLELNAKLGDRVRTKCSYNDTQGLIFEASIDGVNWIKSTHNEKTNYVFPNIENFTIGQYNNTIYSRQDIDLNAFKIYVDDTLVYQPTLRIPYTQSKTGSKIVNSVYRDRVQSMYESFGYADYYTLSDTDFTLPMGEIYGMIDKAYGMIDKAYGMIDTKVDLPTATSASLPSDRYTDLILGVSGSTYTAPADGWFMFYTIKSRAGYTYLKNVSNDFMTEGRSTLNGAGCSAWIPANKDDVILITYDGTDQNPAFRFYYANGSKEEV